MQTRQFDRVFGVEQLSTCLANDEIMPSANYTDFISGIDRRCKAIDKTVRTIRDIPQGLANPTEDIGVPARYAGSPVGRAKHYDPFQFSGMKLAKHRTHQDVAHAVRDDVKLLNLGVGLDLLEEQLQLLGVARCILGQAEVAPIEDLIPLATQSPRKGPQHQPMAGVPVDSDDDFFGCFGGRVHNEC